ncbi:MAG: radical SAM protein [Clostridiaceae bacterium]|jgi:pyruvate-formate lyase-activating enzyme|nr:radical SAM protein [Clostridiaceae bacterium]
MKEAAYYEKLDNGSVRCRLCPHRCFLQPGRTGLCRARRNIDGTLYSLNYGYMTSLALDPIEKKPLYHFHPGKIILSAGTFGCNFKCSWCQNWTIAHGDEQAGQGGETDASGRTAGTPGEKADVSGRTADAPGPNADASGRTADFPGQQTDVPDRKAGQEWDRGNGRLTGSEGEPSFVWNYEGIRLVEAPPEKLAGLAEQYVRYGNIGVAYTYNEPTIWYEYVLDTAKLVKENGLANVLVTNGFISEEPLEELLPYIDAMNIDVKAFTGEFCKKYCKGGLDDVKRTVERAARNCHVEVTTLVIPGLNDSPEEIDELARWLSAIDRDIVLHLTRFFPNYRMRSIGPTPLGTLEKAKKTALRHLNHVYLGNV